MKRIILLADDDPSVRASLTNLIESENYTVLQAADGRSAIGLLASANADLVLLDVNMPYMEEWQTYEWLNQQRPEIPIIIISARSPSDCRALRSGRDTFMEKPLEPKHLLETIRRLIWQKDDLGAADRSGLQTVAV